MENLLVILYILGGLIFFLGLLWYLLRSSRTPQKTSKKVTPSKESRWETIQKKLYLPRISIGGWTAIITMVVILFSAFIIGLIDSALEEDAEDARSVVNGSYVYVGKSFDTATLMQMPTGGFPLYFEVTPNKNGITIEDLDIQVKIYKHGSEGGTVVEKSRNAFWYIPGSPLANCSGEFFRAVYGPKNPKDRLRDDIRIIARIDTTKRCLDTGVILANTR